jgi:hypothetical protein
MYSGRVIPLAQWTIPHGGVDRCIELFWGDRSALLLLAQVLVNGRAAVWPLAGVKRRADCFQSAISVRVRRLGWLYAS